MAEPLDIPEEILRAAPPSDQLRKDAGWAMTFGRNTSNSTQRERFQGDLDSYAQQLLASRQAAEQRRLEVDSGARALAAQNAKLRQAAELHPLNIRLKEAQIAAQGAAERRRIQEDSLKEMTNAQEAEFFADRAAFLLQNPAATPDQIEDADISRGARFPQARRGKEAAALLTMAERSALARKQEAMRAARPDPNAPIEIGEEGDGVFRIRGQVYKRDEAGNLLKVGTERPPAKSGEANTAVEKPVDPFKTLAAEKKQIEGVYGKYEKAPDALKKAYENKLRTAESEFVTKNAPAKSAPEKIATNPKTGEKLVLRDGKWQPLK